MLYIHAAYQFHRGFLKPNNEDNFLFSSKTLKCLEKEMGNYEEAFMWTKSVCFGVFDGLGGLPDGEKASFMAASTLLKRLNSSLLCKYASVAWLEKSFQHMNQEVFSFEDKNGYRIGTTAAVIVIGRNQCVIGNVGDSRIYCVQKGKLKQLSTDHSDRDLIKELGIKGRRPSLMQYVGISPTIHPAISVIPHCCSGRYLVCSDGLTDMVPDPDIEEICNKTQSPLECATELLECALKNGGKDNITVIILDLEKRPLIEKKRMRALINSVGRRKYAENSNCNDANFTDRDTTDH